MKVQILVLFFTIILIHSEVIYNPQISTATATQFNIKGTLRKSSCDMHASKNNNNVPQYYGIYPPLSTQKTASGTTIQPPPPINIEIKPVTPPIVKPPNISSPSIKVDMYRPCQSVTTIPSHPSKSSPTIIQAQVCGCQYSKNSNNHLVQQSIKSNTVTTINPQPQSPCQQLIDHATKQQPIIVSQCNSEDKNTNLINGDDNNGIGTNNIINGNDNMYHGDQNQINGECNTCLGNSNEINGDKNSVVGCSNEVYGECNKIIGSDNTVIGSNQINTINIKNILPPQSLSYNNYLRKDYISFQY